MAVDGVQAEAQGDGGADGHGLAAPDVADDHAERRLGDAETDARHRLGMGGTGEEVGGGDALGERRAGQPEGARRVCSQAATSGVAARASAPLPGCGRAAAARPRGEPEGSSRATSTPMAQRPAVSRKRSSRPPLKPWFCTAL
ncbi:MAG: hypothetical protein JWM18_721 [Chloroflexi bacterium]|jgi:hypothetical protein|nr:hypothetical protein [Chloroflexota bacterium]